MRGRKPKPPGLKALSNARPSGYDRGITPPDIEPSAPAKPSWVTGTAEAMWDELVPRLSKANILTPTDVYNLGAMCEAWGDYRAIVDMKRYFKTGSDDQDKPFNINKEVRDARAHFERLSSKFGLTPVDRMRIDCPVPERQPGGKMRHIK